MGGEKENKSLGVGQSSTGFHPNGSSFHIFVLKHYVTFN